MKTRMLCATLGALALGAVVGSIPGTLLTTFFGSSLSQGKTWTTMASVVGLLLSLTLGIILGRRLAKELKVTEGEPTPSQDERPATAAPVATTAPVMGSLSRGVGA